MKKLLLGLFLIIQIAAFSQDFSNKGKDFWLGYGYHCQMVNSASGVIQATGGSQDMILYFTSDQNASVTVEIPSVGYIQTYNVIANQVTQSLAIPKTGSQDARIVDTGKYNRGIHVYSDKPIVAYAHIYNNAISGASLLFPTNTLGQEYYSVNYNQVSNQNFSNSFCFVVATEDNTTVEITPITTNKNNRPVGIPFLVYLNKGEIYNLMGTTSGGNGTDLTGTKIRSIAGVSGCKKIAVFSGSGKISIPTGSADNLFQQALPSNAWGKEYLTTPTTSQAFNFFRVIVKDPTTVVKLNGVTMTGLINNFYYQFGATNQPNYITADKSIMVAQYCTTQGQSGNGTPGDPEMIYLSSIEQTINDITLNSTPYYQILVHYINVVVKAGGQNSFKLDNINRASSFVPHPQNPNFYYASFNITAGSHRLVSDSGFNAIAYGFGNAESYGYNAGTNVIDLYQYVSVQNQFATINFPATCKNTPFFFSITLPYQATALTWNFNNNAALTPNATVVNNSPVADSTFIRDGKTLYVYKLPGNYNFNAPGTHPIKVIANNPSPDGCSGTQEISYDVQVYEQPLTDFNITHSGCLSDTATFTDITNGYGRPTVKWKWEFGDATTDTVKISKKKYATAGTFNVKLTSYTDIGCIGDTVKPFTISSQPVAKFGIQDTTCIGDVISFSDTSTIAVGSLVKWYWDFGNGNTVVNTTNASVTQVYNTAGNYTVTLQVESNTGCKSTIFSKIITIKPKPVPDFSLANVCLPIGAAQFTNLTTISSSESMTYLWNFGNSTTSTNQNPSTTYSTTGPFTVNLQVYSLSGCLKDTTKTISNIWARPTASFNVTTDLCVSDSAALTDLSTAANSTVAEWFWDFGDGTISAMQNPKKKYAVSGTYNIKLYIKSAIGCISDTMTKQIIVHKLPTAIFGTSLPSCETKQITITDTSVANSGILTTWNWNFGNGNNLIVTNNNPINQVYNTNGTYTVSLMVVSDRGCKSDTLNKLINIYALPAPNFSFSTIVCLPDGNAQFTDLSTISDGTQAQFTYNWNFGDGGTSIVKNPIHQYTAVGPFNVKLEVTSNNNCKKDTTIELNTIYPRPKADFTLSSEVCLRDTTLFTDLSIGYGSNVTQWRWDFGDGATSTLQNPKHRYLTAGTFTVTLFIYTDKGCISDTMTKTTIVNPLPIANFITSTPSCETKQITFTDQSTANAGNLTNWYWDFNDATVASYTNSNPFQKTFANWGNYNVKLSLLTNKGCKSDTLTKAVFVNPQPVPGFILPDVCLTDAFALFTDTSKIADNSQALFSYAWNFGDPNANVGNPNTSTLQSPQHKYTAVGIYNVSLTVTSNNACVTSLTKAFTVNGSIPKANFTILNATALCSNLAAEIQNTSTVDFGNITRVDVIWDLVGASSIISIDNSPTPGKIYSNLYPNFQSPLSKTYTVKMKSYSGLSCVDSISKVITVNASPKVSFQTMPGICFEATPRQITQASEIGSVPGTFTYIGNGVSSSGLFNPNTAAVGTHNIKYLFTSNMGCKDSATKPITVWPSPTANWGYTNPTCEKNAITFSDTSLANYSNLIQWNWIFGEGNTATYTNGNNFPKTYTNFGSYTASLQVRTDSGCVSTVVPKTIQIYPLPLVDFSIPSICLPDGNGQFNDLSSIPDASQLLFSYNWNFGDGSSNSVQKNPIHKYFSTGPFSVKLKIISNNNCIDSVTKSISTIYPQPKSDFSFNPNEVCLGAPFSFTDLSVSISAPINLWNWSFGDGTTASTKNTTKIYSNAGTYIVSLYIFNQLGCVSDTMSKAVTVHPYPTVNAGPDLFVLAGGQATLNPIVTGSSLQFLWTPSLYLDNPTIKNPITKPLDDITYKLTVTGIGNCSVNDEVFVKFLKRPEIPNAFSPNGDGINDTWIIRYLESYPGTTVEIFNRDGQAVFFQEGYTKPWNGTTKGKPLPVGTYYYIVNPKNGLNPITGSVTIIK